MFWVEIDSYSPEALGYIRRQSPHPISSCETLLGLREFLPYFREQAMDVAIIDAVWNGVWQAMKIANAAEAFEVNIAPHNFYGHLATMMNAHFAAAVPNLRIMEVDIDRLPWDDELSPPCRNSITDTWWFPPPRAREPNPTRKRSAPARRKRRAACCITGSLERRDSNRLVARALFGAEPIKLTRRLQKRIVKFL
jgi:galactonate dehydratase